MSAGGWLIVTPRFDWMYPDRVTRVVKTRFVKNRPSVLKNGEMAIKVEAIIPASAFTPKVTAEVTF